MYMSSLNSVKMMRVDNSLRVRQVGERILHNLCKALTALGLIRDREIDVGRSSVLLSLGLQELAAS